MLCGCMSTPQAKTRVLIVDNSTYLTGALNSILNFTDGLSGNFEFQFVMSSRSNAVGLIESRGYKVHRLPFLEISKSLSVLLYFPQLFVNARKLQHIIAKERISVLHVNDLYNQLGTLSKLLNPRLRVIYHVRLLPGCYLGRFYFVFARLIQAKADKILCVSDAVHRHFRGADNALIVPDGLVKQEALATKRYWQNLPACEVLYLANYVPGKGHTFALEALRLALCECPNIHLRMMGSTNGNPAQEKYLAKLKLTAAELGVESRITFCGSTNDVEKEMKTADIVMNLSESESFSMVCLEALMYGLPLIVSDCGGPSELFEDGKSGILTVNRCPSSAANALIKLIKNRDLAESMGRSGKALVEKKFDRITLLSRMNTIYNENIAVKPLR